MTHRTEMLIKELSENLKAALEKDQFELAKEINQKINQLIEYGTGVKA